jgi:hypothetical protein
MGVQNWQSCLTSDNSQGPWGYACRNMLRVLRNYSESPNPELETKLKRLKIT